ncbi:MAG: hypothetical protein HFE84_04290 [Lachnospiraceae bacterium]|nr:hypothetical protein [Lachnospiraceae bacterium]
MISIIYMILATAMFFLQDTYFLIGDTAFSLKNPCAAAIVFLALLNIAATVRMGRIILLAHHTAIQMLPCVIPFFFSSVIWVAFGADSSAVVNGIGMIVPQLLSVLVAASTLYLFGAKGIWYCLGAMCAANFIGVLVVIKESGFDAFCREFGTLLITFSKETGPLMERLEVHDLTFAFGPFLIWLLLNQKEVSHPLLCLTVVSVFFLVGLKRIAVPAVILGVLAAFLLRRLPDTAARQTALCAAAGLMIVSFLYIAGIRYGLFAYLEERLQIDTMGRVAMFTNLEPYYDISFTYLGRGTGFERLVDWASGTVYQTPRRDLMQIHNDFLRMYLNIGFLGYWVWIWSYLIVRLGYWFRQGGKNTGCLFFGICVYCFVLYATDNTIYYPYTMIACSLVPMSCRLDELADAALKKRLAQWSRKGDTAL